MSAKASPPLAPDAILGPDVTVDSGIPGPIAAAAICPGARGTGTGGSGGPLAVPGASLGGHGTGAQTVRGVRAKRLERIARADERIRARATSILEAALRAPELADLPETPPGAIPDGWTKKTLRIAADATNSMKAAPAYLGMAQRIHESYRKAESDKPAAPTINAEVVQVQVNQFNYPRRRLTE